MTAEVSLFTVGNDLEVIPYAAIMFLNVESIGFDKKAGNSSDIDGPDAISSVGIVVITRWVRKCLKLSDDSAAIRMNRFTVSSVYCSRSRIVRRRSPGRVILGGVVRSRRAGNQGKKLK